MSFLNNRSGIVSTKVNECPNIYSKPIFICDDLIFVLLRACLRENNANMEKKQSMNLKFHFTSKLISCSKTSPLGVTNGTLSNLEKKR